MIDRRAAALLGAMLVALVPAGASAQEDFRALDLDRPIRVVDAYPKKFLEWELQLGARGEVADGSRGIGGALALETGLFRNFEVGVEIEPAWEDVDGEGSSSGVEGLGIHALYNFNQESWRWPALSVHFGVEAPAGGSLGRSDWGTGARLIATRSFPGRTRVHANAGYFEGTEADGGDHWLAGLAFDHPIGLFSRLLMGGVYAELPAEEGRTRVWAEVGSRLQLTNLSVLDFGISTRPDEWSDGRSNVQLVLGFSRAFGVAAFVAVPPYPEPAIR